MCPESYEIIFCWVSYFLLLLFCAQLMRGHDFWVQFEMCWQIFDLLPLILNNGAVSGEMRLYVALMPVVIKFGPSDYGTL